MKHSIIKYGLIAGSIIVLIPFLLEQAIGVGPDTYAVGEVVGYSSMILSLLLIIMAIKECQQKFPDRPFGFKQVMQIGLGVSAIAGVMFGLYNWVYVTFIAPEFMQEYFAYYIENIQNSDASEADKAEQIARLESDKALFMNPLVGFFTMFLTVFLIGALISLISGLFMPKKQPAQAA